MLFLDRLDQAIRRAQRHHPECCAGVLFLDLDRFKVINDSLGHAVGDQLLQAVARRLEAALRPNDSVARLSGDEFTVLLDDVCDPREATVIAERVLQSLQTPFLLDGRELFIGASIGIALATAASAPEQVMRDSDVAMYRAKADGKGRHKVFDAAMHEQVMRRLDMEGELRAAIERSELEVVYMPIVQAATGRIVGFEALCRWTCEAPIEPPTSSPIAEETGLIVPLGRRVLETACRELAGWRELPQGPARSSASTSPTASSPSRASRAIWRRCSSARGWTRGRCGWRSRARPGARARRDRAGCSRRCSRSTACAGTSTTSGRARRRCGCCTASPGTR